VIWTIILINLTTEKAEHHTVDSLPHDGDKALAAALELFKGCVIVSMVKGDHRTGAYIPDNIISISHTRREA
jgi:hypothetical protein